jgi:hypothetical protein
VANGTFHLFAVPVGDARPITSSEPNIAFEATLTGCGPAQTERQHRGTTKRRIVSSREVESMPSPAARMVKTSTEMAIQPCSSVLR